MLSHFHLIPERYGRTDRRRDRIAINISVLTRDKNDKNLAIANSSRVSCAHNTLRASIGINITP